MKNDLTRLRSGEVCLICFVQDKSDHHVNLVFDDTFTFNLDLLLLHPCTALRRVTIRRRCAVRPAQPREWRVLLVAAAART